MKSTRIARLLALLLTLATLLHFGCSENSQISPVGPSKITAPPSAIVMDDGDDDGDDDDGDDDFLTVGQRDPDDEGVTTALIGPAGGVITHGDHRVVIPAGALDQTIEISFSVPESDTLMFDLSPHGTQFNVPISLIFEYDSANLDGVDVSHLQLVGYYNSASSVWEPMPTTVDAVNDVIIGQTTHFSRYAIIR